MSYTKDLEDGIASHQTTVTTVNGTGEEIIKQSTQFEGDMLREKLNTINRRWQVVCSEVADRRDRYVRGDNNKRNLYIAFCH